jgi:hypothetical protein
VYEEYFHRRDKDGVVAVPVMFDDEPMEKLTFEEEMAQLHTLAKLISPQNMADCEAKLRAKFGKE